MLEHLTQSGLASRDLFPGAALAGDHFLCLSGFVLARSYDERLREGMTAGTFMLRRYIRLYPMYFLGTVLGLAVQVLAPTVPVHLRDFVFTLAMSLLFLPTLSPFPVRAGHGVVSDFPFPFNAPAWSLCLELAVNWIYGVSRPRMTALLVTVAVAFLALLQVVLHKGFPPGFTVGSLAGGMARALFSFFAGVLVFRVWRLRPPRLPAFAPALSCMLVVAMAAVPGGRLTYLGCVLAVPVLVWAGTVNPATAVERRLYDWLGEISYPVYAIHFPVVMAVQALFYLDGAGTKLSLPTVFGIAGFVILLSFGLSRLWDIPVRRRLTGWFEGGGGVSSARRPRA